MFASDVLPVVICRIRYAKGAPVIAERGAPASLLLEAAGVSLEIS